MDEPFGIDLGIIKLTGTYYQKGYKEDIIRGNKSKIINLVKETSVSKNDDISVEGAIEIFSSLGVSVSFSWKEISISLYTRLSNTTVKLTAFISLNIFWGTHGFRLSIEQDNGKGYTSGLVLEASAHALVIVFALAAIYGYVPSLIPLLLPRPSN